MFQSIEYIRSLGYDVATDQYEYEYELIDSDFRCVGVAVGVSAVIVIQEYSKRKLNVAANLIRCFKYQEKKFGWPISEQIARAEKYQPAFTPELKADLAKYLTIL
jgi:hypothetical protein